MYLVLSYEIVDEPCHQRRPWLRITVIKRDFRFPAIHLVFQSVLQQKAAMFILQGVALPLSYAGAQRFIYFLNFSNTNFYFSMAILAKKNALFCFFEYVFPSRT